LTLPCSVSLIAVVAGVGAGLALIDLSVLECATGQSWRCKLAWVGEVVWLFSMSRQSVRTWMSRYREAGTTSVSGAILRSCRHHEARTTLAAAAEFRRFVPASTQSEISRSAGRCPSPAERGVVSMRGLAVAVVIVLAIGMPVSAGEVAADSAAARDGVADSTEVPISRRPTSHHHTDRRTLPVPATSVCGKSTVRSPYSCRLAGRACEEHPQLPRTAKRNSR
jgi:hypothetical protein